jgi:GntR family transcriptional regulator
MLDKQSPIPIYYQIQKILLNKIEKGVWSPKTRLPSERELAEQFNVSRMTMRNALEGLERSGVLTREIGRGTFVAEPRLTSSLSTLTGFSAEMKALGKQASARVLRLETRLPFPKITNLMNLDPTQELVVAERLRFTDNEPMAIETCYLNFPDCRNLLQEDLTGSLYQILISKFDLIPSHARQQITAGLSNKTESELLGIKTRSAVLRLNRLTCDQNQQPFEFVESTYRGDKYIFDAELTLSYP